MRLLYSSTAAALAATLLISTTATAQKTPPPPPSQGVRLGLNYALGSKPGVLVLPMAGEGGDSVRAILQRDLDYDDRVNVIALDAAAARGMMPEKGDKFNYPLFAKLGVVVILRPQIGLSGLTISMYDVAARKVVQSGNFLVSPDLDPAAWRMAVHGASDEIGRWMFGKRGIAQTRILYSGTDSQIWIIDSDGANARKLTSIQLAMSPAWHPGGQSFVFSGFTARGSQIGVFSFATGDLTWKSATTRGLNITPVLAPNGHTLVYANGAERGTDLMLADLDSDIEARRITVGKGSDNTSPSFSPDGRQIVFMSGRAGHPEVYIMDTDGTNAQLLTDFTYGEQSYRASPDWAPDGRLIAYQSRIAGDFQIMTMDLRDRSTKQLTSDGENEDPSWAADARHLVFSSTRSGVRQLWVIDTESGRLRQLTKHGGRLAAWSPMLK